ncbi:MAG: hypothetical protein ACRC46_04345 [Thermoguttaceae bacterium]
MKMNFANWNRFALSLVVAGAVFGGGFAQTLHAATYTVGTGGDYATLEALRTAHPSLGTADEIVFLNDDNSLTAAFGFAANSTLTLSSDATIGTAIFTRFINAGANDLTLVVADGSNLTINGFKSVTSNGGAIRTSSSNDFTLGTASSTGVIAFTANSAAVNGGAIRARNAYITGGNNTFTSNSTDLLTGSNGGAICGENRVVISGGTNTFVQNQAGLHGGAIFAGDNLKITGGVNTFTGNFAKQNGGALNSNSSLEISGGTNSFVRNQAQGDPLETLVNGQGGAVYVERSAIFRASSGNFLFQGNLDNTATSKKANAIYMHNHLTPPTVTQNSLTLAATSGNSILFDDPITSRKQNSDGDLLLLDIFINPVATDSGKVVFDGIGKSTVADRTSAVYGNTTVSHGELALRNGVTYGASDNSGSFTLGANATLLTNATSTNTINAGTITLGGTLAFDMSGAVANTSLGATKNLILNGTTSVTGDPTTIDIRGLKGSGGAPTTYDLATRIIGWWDMGTPLTIDGVDIALTRANGKMALFGGASDTLQVMSVAETGLLKWSGGNGNWNLTENKWNATLAGGAASDKFLSGDSVQFDWGTDGAIAVASTGVTVGANSWNPGMAFGAGTWSFTGGEIRGGEILSSNMGDTTLIFGGVNATGTREMNQRIVGYGAFSTLTFIAAAGETVSVTGRDTPQDGNAISIAGNLVLGAAGAGTLQYSHNYGGNYGGVMYAAKTATIVGGTNNFTSNKANAGGAMYAGGDMSINGGTNTFTSNNAATGNGGGAIYSGGAVTIAPASGDTATNVFTDNNANKSGGAIYAVGGVQLANSTNTFSGNQSGEYGGAIYADGSVSVSSGTNTFTGNMAKNGGAIALSPTVPGNGIEISGGTNRFLGNEASEYGGAIYADHGNVTLAADVADMIFKGNRDRTDFADNKANAIHMNNADNVSWLLLSAKAGHKIEFFDPITSNSTNPNLTININAAATDTGAVVFDGSYWKSKNSTNAADFTTTLYGTNTVSHGSVAVKNGVIFDLSASTSLLGIADDAKFDVSSGSTLISRVDNKFGTVTSNIIANDTLIFSDATACWTIVAGPNVTGSEVSGLTFTDATNIANANAALNAGNAANLFTDWQIVASSVPGKMMLQNELKKDINVSNVAKNVAGMVQFGKFQAVAATRGNFFGGNSANDYRGQNCRSNQSKLRGNSVWINYVGRSTELEATNTLQAGLKNRLSSNGVQTGLDLYRSRSTVLGAVFGYEALRSDIAADRVKGNDYYFGLYGAQKLGSGFDVRGSLGYGHQTYKMDRYDNGLGAPVPGMYHSEFSGDTFETSFDVGRRMHLSRRFSYRPMIGFDFYTNDVNGAPEDNDGLILSSTSLTQTFVRFGSDVVWQSRRLEINGGAYYAYQMAPNGHFLRTGVSNGVVSGTAYGARLGNSVVTFNAGTQYYLNAQRTLSVYGNYSGNLFADRPSSPWGHTVFAGAAWRF